ncbi:hypothetical protein T4B_9033 [Trichinella pseudospiralis]|uniref:Uncharacterized protein n=1 Tax=Trichinella pseudospiralis TaxID=6337 RepID=A0A0V1GM74_TRIPS|nr:hypothetical protein T4B_9033 [Trichinella pseudospiralis]
MALLLTGMNFYIFAIICNMRCSTLINLCTGLFELDKEALLIVRESTFPSQS